MRIPLRMGKSRRISGWLLGCLIAYAALMAAVVGSMFWVRHSVLAELSTPESIADWQTWRDDVSKQQTNPGPVQRDVPKSDEPPALVLMRDYFAVSLVGRDVFQLAAVLDHGVVRDGHALQQAAADNVSDDS